MEDLGNPGTVIVLLPVIMKNQIQEWSYQCMEGAVYKS